MTEISLFGKKIGMSREFYKTGQSIPVTVLKMEPGRIIQLISMDKRGYQAIQVGFGAIKTSKLSKGSKLNLPICLRSGISNFWQSSIILLTRSAVDSSGSSCSS